LHDELNARGALVTKPLEERPWSCRDFYLEDPDGYILCFSEQMRVAVSQLNSSTRWVGDVSQSIRRVALA
jgi:hypothetical protein